MQFIVNGNDFTNAINNNNELVSMSHYYINNKTIIVSNNNLLFELASFLKFNSLYCCQHMTILWLFLIHEGKRNWLSIFWTHFWPMFPFYTPWKHQKTFVFRGYKMGTLAKNGLTYSSPVTWSEKKLIKESSLSFSMVC